MRFRIPLHAVLYLTLQGSVISKVWVKQWSTQGQCRVGDNATLHCAIFSDKETLEDCDINWVLLNLSNSKKTVKIMESERYAGRVKVEDKNDTTTTIIIQNQRPNDPEVLCRMDCFVDGLVKRTIGRGDCLKIVESQHAKKSESESSQSLNWLSYFLFAVNILIFIVVTVACSISVRRRLGNKF
ncbi:hypothetical protein GJAV_G00005090 [Gymnothorax javanicus]|nr:hypothetical protein GJAV_G00005090 [Gymnothorax javanicus]